MSLVPADAGTHERPRLLRRGLRLEYATLAWNVMGCAVLAAAAMTAGSVALAGFGIDSLIEIVASLVVVWQLQGTDDPSRTRPALRIISVSFGLLAIYIAVQSLIVLVGASSHPSRSNAITSLRSQARSIVTHHIAVLARSVCKSERVAH